MKKCISGIIICLLAIFLMSHNVQALSDYNVHTGLRTLSYYGYDGSSSVNNCNNGNNKYYLDYFRTSNFDVHKGKMVIAIGFQNSKNDNGFDGYIPVSWTARPYISPAAGVEILVLDVEVVSNSPSQSTLYLLIDSNYSWTNGSLVLTPATEVQLNPGECWEKGFTTDIGISYMELQDITSELSEINDLLEWLNIAVDEIRDRDPAPTAEENADAIADEQEERTQSASDDAQAGADDSGEEAEEATSGLIDIIGGFVSAITNASPSNCNINGNMGHLNMGIIDMCSMPVPSFVQIIGSIILILVCIPFVIIMFNRFISLFRSFQG